MIRGVKPTNPRLAIAAGDPRKIGKRKLAEQVKAEPPTTHGYPPCPSHVRGHARALWEFLVPELTMMQIDRKPTAAALSEMCKAYGQSVEADIIVHREGLVVEKKVFDRYTETFVVVDRKPHPAVAIALKNKALFLRYCSEFGLTPVSITRLTAAKESDKDMAKELANMLNAPREGKRTA